MAKGAFSRGLLALLTTFVGVWIAMIMYWRSSGTMPTGRDMLMYMGLLPTSLYGGIWMLRSLGSRMQSLRTTSASVSEPQADAAGDGDVHAARVLSPSAQVLATSLQLPLPGGAARILQADGSLPAPGLHPSIKNPDGLPVPVGHVPDLDLERAVDAMEMAGFGGGEARRLPEEQLRAIALLAPVVSELIDAVYPLFAPAPEVEERVVAGLRRREETAIRDVVFAEVLVPLDWSPSMQQAVSSWVTLVAMESGLDGEQIEVGVRAVRGDGGSWEYLGSLASDTVVDGGRLRRWRMIVSADSGVSARYVTRLANSGRLVGHRNPNGTIPGEAAAGILLAPDMDAAAEWNVLATRRVAAHAPSHLELGAPTGSKARARSSADMVRSAIASAGIEADAVGLFLSDAGHGPESLTEAHVVASTVFPESDHVARCIAPLSAVGDAGVCAPLVLVALAAEHVRQQQSAAVILRVEDPVHRSAMVLSIGPEQTAIGSVAASTT